MNTNRILATVFAAFLLLGTAFAYPSVTVVTESQQAAYAAPYAVPVASADYAPSVRSRENTVIYNPYTGNVYTNNGRSGSNSYRDGYDDGYDDGFEDGSRRRGCTYNWFGCDNYGNDGYYGDRDDYDSDSWYRRCRNYDPRDDEWYDRDCDDHFRYRSSNYGYYDGYNDYNGYGYDTYDYRYNYPQYYTVTSYDTPYHGYNARYYGGYY